MADSNYSLAAAGVSTTSAVVRGFAETEAFERNITRQVNAKIASMDSLMTSYEFEAVKSQEKVNELNELLGDKLSERSMQALKTQARLRVAAAETGVTGGTTDEAIKEAFSVEHFDRANIIAGVKNQVRAVATQMDSKTIKLQSELKALSSGLPTVDTDQTLATIGGGLSTATSALGMLTPRQREEIFT